MRQAGATLRRGAWASPCRGLSCCGAQAPDTQAQQLRLTGLVTPRHVGSSQTRARTRVPCIGRQILNHCATREALDPFLIGVLKSPTMIADSSIPLCISTNFCLLSIFPCTYLPSIYLLGEVTVHIFCPFFIGWFVFLLLSFQSSFFIFFIVFCLFVFVFYSCSGYNSFYG